MTEEPSTHHSGFAFGRSAALVDTAHSFAHTRAYTPLREALRALRIGVDPMEGAPMLKARFSQPRVPRPLPAVPIPPRFLVRPQRLTGLDPLPVGRDISPRRRRTT